MHLWGADDQAALAAAHRGDEVDDAAGEVGGVVGGELEALVGEDGGEFVEDGALDRVVGCGAVGDEDLAQGVVLLAVAGRAGGADRVVAGAEAAAADEVLGDEDVGGAREQCFAAEEAVGIVDHFEHAAGEDFAGGFGLGLEQEQEQVLLGQVVRALDVERAGVFDEVLAGARLEIGDVQRRHWYLACGPPRLRRGGAAGLVSGSGCGAHRRRAMGAGGGGALGSIGLLSV